MKILYITGSWYANIGDAFIDLGALYQLKKAAPNATINITSGMGYYEDNKIGLDPIEDGDVDYIVFSGMTVHSKTIELYGKSLLNQKNNAKIIFLGAGGENYPTGDILSMQKFFYDLKPYTLISRDKFTYEYYKDYFDKSYEGIDVAFSLPLVYTPVKLDKDYSITNIERPLNKTSEELKSYLKKKNKISIKNDCSYKGRTAVSTPYSFLNIYANANEVFTSRIHTTIACICYGTPVQLLLQTRRIAIFERLGIPNPMIKLTTFDYEPIKEEVDKQIKYLSGVLK